MVKDTEIFNLKDFLSKLVKKFPVIRSCYLFGSRAYRTGSLRSDIDILVYTEEPLKQAQVIRFCKYYKPIDLFETSDNKTAKSLTNGSAVYDKKDLIQKLDAIKLWENGGAFTNDSFHKHEILKNVEFIPSILPIRNLSTTIDEAIPKTGLGSNWVEVSKRIIKVINNSLSITAKLKNATQAKYINRNSIIIDSEYDFQNYTYIVLKPWIDSLESEPFEVRFAGGKKNADFGISDNLLIIEEKYINSKGKENDVLKTIEGLNSYYKSVPNVRAVLFIILFDKSLNIDNQRIESMFTHYDSTPITVCTIMKNDLIKQE